MDYYLGTDLSINCLSHHGIKGMKWGIRRYQNEDGSLTVAGKERYKEKEVRSKAKAEQFERQTNPYGHGRSVTAEQHNRKNRDQIKYGAKGLTRIEDRLDRGKTYNQAVRPEKLLRGAKSIGYSYLYDQMATLKKVRRQHLATVGSNFLIRLKI